MERCKVCDYPCEVDELEDGICEVCQQQIDNEIELDWITDCKIKEAKENGN